MVRSGYDYRHYMTMDADAHRTGWTILRCPGAFNVKAGDDIPYNSNSIYFEAINGDIAQNQRERIIQQLKNGKIDILIATDVAARGLDVD